MTIDDMTITVDGVNIGDKIESIKVVASTTMIVFCIGEAQFTVVAPNRTVEYTNRDKDKESNFLARSIRTKV